MHIITLNLDNFAQTVNPTLFSGEIIFKMLSAEILPKHAVQ